MTSVALVLVGAYISRLYVFMMYVTSWTHVRFFWFSAVIGLLLRSLRRFPNLAGSGSTMNSLARYLADWP